MSRHRNIRNLTEDDYYDDYDDDYYDDDEYYEDDYYEAPPKPKAVVKKAPAKASKTSSVNSSNKSKSSSLGSGKGGITGTKKSTSASATGVGVTSSSSNLLSSKKSTGSYSVEEKKKRVSALQAELKGCEDKQISKQLSVVILGHVDAGKSTLVGQLLVQCGMIPKSVVQQYQKEASLFYKNKTTFAYAWILDQDETERERGVTMDIGTRLLNYNHIQYTLLDAPGHEEFVPAMITGTAQADIGLLVINASSKKSFQAGLNGQTLEHITLARALGIAKLIVALNQLDNCDFDQNIYQHIQTQLTPLLHQHGFTPQETPFLPLSGLSGINLTNTQNNPASLTSWYHTSQPTLLQTMEKVGDALLENRQNKLLDSMMMQPLRLLVSEIETEGSTNVVQGRILQGCCFPKDVLQIMPSGELVTITKMNTNATTSASASAAALPQQMVELTLQHTTNNSDVILDTLIRPGTILMDPTATSEKVLYSKFQAQLIFAPTATSNNNNNNNNNRGATTLIVGTQMLFHMHSLELPCTITRFICDPTTMNKKKQKPPPRRISSTSVDGTLNNKPFWAELTLPQPIVVSAYTECKSLGRFVLRKQGTTIALGMVQETLS